MANIDKFKFNPENGWNDTATFPNKQDESKNRDMFNKLPFQLRDFINQLIDILESSESDSGSAHIGAYMIEGLKNTDTSDALTVKEQIEALKRLVDSKSDSEDVYSKENSYSKSETDKLLEIKADDENVYHKNDIEKVLDMTYGSIKSINNIVSTKGNISIVAGAGIKVEIDSTTKTIRIISTGSGTGDMLKDVYDTDNDGIVDNASALGGQSPEYYAKQDDIDNIINGTKQVGDSAMLGGKSADEYTLKSTEIETTLLASSWVENTYTLALSGVTTTSIQELLPSIDITQTQLEVLQGANIQDGGQSTDTIVLKAFSGAPTIDVPVRIILRGDM